MIIIQTTDRPIYLQSVYQQSQQLNQPTNHQHSHRELHQGNTIDNRSLYQPAQNHSNRHHHSPQPPHYYGTLYHPSDLLYQQSQQFFNHQQPQTNVVYYPLQNLNIPVAPTLTSRKEKRSGLISKDVVIKNYLENQLAQSRSELFISKIKESREISEDET